MTKKKQLAILVGISLIFRLVSCEKADDININQLVSKWYIYNDDPNLSVDGSV